MTDNSLTIQDIKNYIPHRYPFLLVDKVKDYRIGESIHAIKNITNTEPILQGHFPGNPIVPGVIIIEGLAQASAILGRLTKGHECSSCLLMEISDTRFRKSVVPGDTLDFFIKVDKARGPFFWFAGEAKVEDTLIATAKFSAKLT